MAQMFIITPVEIDENKLREDLNYSQETLHEDMIKQASLFYYYGALLALASRNVESAKAQLELTEARVDHELREGSVGDATLSKIKITEAMALRAINRHNDVTAARQTLIDCKYMEGLLKVVVEAFRNRKDMLIQMGMLTREEMKGELSIQAKEINETMHKQNNDKLYRHFREMNDTKDNMNE